MSTPAMSTPAMSQPVPTSPGGPRPRVLMLTFALLPHGETGAPLLTEALAERGVDVDWASWDDPAIDRADHPLTVVRSTWDYHRRLPAFLDWARRTEARTTLLNGADVFAWNADKSYLVGMREDGAVPVVPTVLADDENLVAVLGEQTAQWGEIVIKPRVGAGGVGVVVADRIEDPRLDELAAAPWIVQPLLDSVRTDGETSVFVFDGVAVSQVDKLPAPGSGEHRVHEQYGGSSRAVVLDPERGGVAERAVRWAVGRTGADLAYARVDLMRHDGRWSVSELELIEPGLYLDVAPDNAALFAEMVARRLRPDEG